MTEATGILAKRGLQIPEADGQVVHQTVVKISQSMRYSSCRGPEWTSPRLKKIR